MCVCVYIHSHKYTYIWPMKYPHIFSHTFQSRRSLDTSVTFKSVTVVSKLCNQKHPYSHICGHPKSSLYSYPEEFHSHSKSFTSSSLSLSCFGHGPGHVSLNSWQLPNCCKVSPRMFIMNTMFTCLHNVDKIETPHVLIPKMTLFGRLR